MMEVMMQKETNFAQKMAEKIWKELYSDYIMALLTWKALMITMVGVRVTGLAAKIMSD